jgi:hypothetical protein
VDLPIGWSVIANENLTNISSLDDFSSTTATYDVEIRWIPIDDTLAEDGIADDASLVEILQHYAATYTFGATAELADQAEATQFSGQEVALLETPTHALIAFQLADGRPFIGEISVTPFGDAIFQHYKPFVETMFQTVRPLEGLATYEATALASEEPLTVTFAYPSDWVVDDSEPTVILLANDPAVFTDEVAPVDELEVLIIHTETLTANLGEAGFAFESLDPDALAEEALRALYLETSDETLAGVSGAERFDVDTFASAARGVIVEGEETIAFAVDLDNGESVVILAHTLEGKLEAYLPVLWSLVYSLDIPEEE